MEDINMDTTAYMSFNCSSTNGNLTEISLLIDSRTILKKINFSFIDHFCFRKYSFSLDTFFRYTPHILMIDWFSPNIPVDKNEIFNWRRFHCTGKSQTHGQRKATIHLFNVF